MQICRSKAFDFQNTSTVTSPLGRHRDCSCHFFRATILAMRGLSDKGYLCWLRARESYSSHVINSDASRLPAASLEMVLVFWKVPKPQEWKCKECTSYHVFLLNPEPLSHPCLGWDKQLSTFYTHQETRKQMLFTGKEEGKGKKWGFFGLWTTRRPAITRYPLSLELDGSNCCPLSLPLWD